MGVNPSSRRLFQLGIDRFEQLTHRGVGEGRERDIQALKKAVPLYRGGVYRGSLRRLMFVQA